MCLFVCAAQCSSTLKSTILRRFLSAFRSFPGLYLSNMRLVYYSVNHVFADFADAKSLAEMLMRYVVLILICAHSFPFSQNINHILG